MEASSSEIAGQPQPEGRNGISRAQASSSDFEATRQLSEKSQNSSFEPLTMKCWDQTPGIPRCISATVSEVMHKPSSACSAIHVISDADGFGFVILLRMSVSSK